VIPVNFYERFLPSRKYGFYQLLITVQRYVLHIVPRLVLRCVTRCVQRIRIRVRVSLRGYTRVLQCCYRVMVMCM
jgi:hypothetical protein